MNLPPCSTFKELLREYHVELKGSFKHLAREKACIPRDRYDPSSTDEQNMEQQPQLSVLTVAVQFPLHVHQQSNLKGSRAKCTRPLHPWCGQAPAIHVLPQTPEKGKTQRLVQMGGPFPRPRLG